MTTRIQLMNGQNEIYNEAGLQLIGSNGPNQSGLSPKELLESALGLCVSISLQKTLENDRIEFERFPFSVEVTARKTDHEVNAYTNFKVLVKLPATIEPEYKEKLIAIVEQACAISNSLKSEVAIEAVEYHLS
ncbi:OsmC family peroxiredoxin [Paenibacillus sp. 1011MAR3C5]|uniref:OsmC family protein n=1 Tax=Paenibacillus sp. 1011MAR3C5 TaxID=1675787 RepID=UPI000E6B6472|nr:OsmC family protein [Paenibacillus sp. 1011MAR3C5]RJE87488.1 OsmC family peroxiredoxin [Paenibacillus sp. 1011MAR3C5]